MLQNHQYLIIQLGVNISLDLQYKIIMGRRGGRYRGGGGGGGGAGATALALETVSDVTLMISAPPTIINGVYNFVGNQMKFRSQAEQPLNYQQAQQLSMINLNFPGQQMNPLVPQLNPMMQPMGMIPPPPPQNGVIQQININIVGTKTKPASMCCYITTVLCGSFCIFPLCFMCCMWWKKAVYPRYELTAQAYRDIGYFIERNQTANNINLTVVDNAFDGQKAKILYDALSRSNIRTMTFINKALNCNCHFNQADDFKQNMLPIKALNITSSITWGDMIL